MRAFERAYNKLLADKPHVLDGKQKAYNEILWKMRTNGFVTKRGK